MKTLEKKTYAKINFGLQVLSKMADGYHEINTVFLKIPLYDIISIEKSDNLQVSCSIDLGINQEDNLVYKAADKLRKYCGDSKLAAKINIEKHIPFGGGLGGGSSNAAATLTVLNDLWDLNCTYEELHKIGTELGADVPFFLKEGAAEGKGRGEILSFFDYSLPFYVVLVFPNIHVSTPQAYRDLNRSFDYKAETADFKSILLNNEIKTDYKKLVFNDFEVSVFEKHPELAYIKSNLYKSGAVLSLMSGSGSTIFGLFDTEVGANFALEQLSNYRTLICSPEQVEQKERVK